MDGQSNGKPPASPRKQQVLFSIGSYSERDKRVIKKISTNGLFSGVTLRNEQQQQQQQQPPPRRRILRERPASLDAIDSATHSQTLPSLRKFKPLQSLLDDGLVEEADRLIVVEKQSSDGGQRLVEKPSCPPSGSAAGNVCSPGQLAQLANGQVLVDKPSHPPRTIARSLSLEPESQLRHSGKVALTIAAYEGEPRTPTRLGFLPTRLSRSSSKASDISATTPLDEDSTDEPIGSRLQSELLATLKRSNLKKRHDQDHVGETPPPSPAAPADNELVEEAEVHAEQNCEPASDKVKKVAMVLEKSLTFATPPGPASTELPKEIVNKTVDDEENGAPAAEGKEQPKTSGKVQETVAPRDEAKLFENSIEKTLIDAFDEIITLTDDTQKN